MSGSTKEKNWKRAAERENKRRTEAAPLLAHAGLIPLTTPEAVKERSEKGLAAWMKQREEARLRALEVCRIYRAFLAFELSADELDHLDNFWEERIRKGFPETHEYRADYWYQNVKRRAPELIAELETYLETH